MTAKSWSSSWQSATVARSIAEEPLSRRIRLEPGGRDDIDALPVHRELLTLEALPNESGSTSDSGRSSVVRTVAELEPVQPALAELPVCQRTHHL